MSVVNMHVCGTERCDWSAVVWGEPAAAGDWDAEWDQSEDPVTDRSTPRGPFTQGRPSRHGTERGGRRCCQRRHCQL